MPRITINDTKGLYQDSGVGVVVQSKGMEGVVVSSETTLAAAAGDTDIEFAMPAGALVTDFGFVVTSFTDVYYFNHVRSCCCLVKQKHINE